MISAICATSIVQAEHEPVLAETVEMPGNVVGSFFGGGYAKRSHDKKEMKDEQNMKNDKKMRNKKSNRNTTSENSKSKSRKRSRPTEERS